MRFTALKKTHTQRFTRAIMRNVAYIHSKVKNLEETNVKFWKEKERECVCVCVGGWLGVCVCVKALDR